MSDEKVSRVDLVFKAQVASIPIAATGSLVNGKLGELGGSAEFNQSLAALFEQLRGSEFEEVADLLEQIVGKQTAESIKLKRLGFSYQNVDPAFVQLALSIGLGKSEIRFALLKTTKGNGLVAGLGLAFDPDLFSDNILSGLVGKISLGDLGLYLSNQAFPQIPFDPAGGFADATELLPSETVVKGLSFNKGLNLTGQLSVGRLELLDFLGDNSEGAQATETKDNEKEQEKGGELQKKSDSPLPATASAKWVKLDKTIGPLFIRRVGFGFNKPRIMILMDGGVNLSRVVLTLMGVGMSYPIDKITFIPKEILKAIKFHLDGASLALDFGPVAVAGGLLKVSESPLQLDGTLMLRIGTFNLGAIGSYADLNGTPSLFIFAAFQQILGGPPYFVVAGLSFGFGINRALEIPAMDQVSSFPLVKAATDPFYLGSDLDLRDVSEKLGKYIYPSVGNFWVAAGLKFISFGVINGFALASVSVGIQFQVALLGLANVRMPPQPPGAPKVEPVASAELAIKVCVSFSSGLLAVEGQLTENSFILTRDCRLTGGFAFNIWFCPKHLGDFVVSLGGYHPKFTVPAHYPAVPRLGLEWKVSKYLSITGGLYFALTPSCCMVGGRLDASFSMGGVRAWFQAYADFLIAWKPFFYDVAIGVAMGVSYTMKVLGISKTFSIELSAKLHLWGPAFGGIARVKWYIISIDIELGDANAAEPAALDWQEFHQSFLPQAEANTNSPTKAPQINQICISSGLILEQKRDNGETVKVVNGHQFSFVTEAAMPCTELTLNGRKVGGTNTPLGIKPMAKERLHSTHAVVLERVIKSDFSEGAENDEQLDQYLKHEVKKQGMPEALWSNNPARPKTPTANMIQDVPNGMKVNLDKREPTHALAFIDLAKLQYERFDKAIPWERMSVPGTIPAYDDKSLMSTIMDKQVDQQRRQILDILNQQEDMELQEIALDELAVDAQEIFQSLPSMAQLGEPL